METTPSSELSKGSFASADSLCIFNNTAKTARQLLFTREMQKLCCGVFKFAFLVNSCTSHSAVNPPILLTHPWERVSSVGPCLPTPERSGRSLEQGCGALERAAQLGTVPEPRPPLRFPSRRGLS